MVLSSRTAEAFTSRKRKHREKTQVLSDWCEEEENESAVPR
jgi:hypothetical protein